MSLLYIGQQITIYSGLFLVVAGLIGNGINIFIFSSVRTYRRTSCTFCFLIASIYNIVYIAINLTSRIAMTGYGFDLSQTSPSWCKMRQFIATVISITSLSCSCLATIDHYFATSRSVNLRRLNNIKWTHRIMFIFVIVWFLHGIPVLLFYDISPITNSCINTNYAYSIYYPIYVMGLLCAVPVLLMAIFGYLTYRNIHLTRVLAQQQADRQITRMILFVVVLAIISFAPFGIINAYRLMKSNVHKDANRLMSESFALTIFTLMSSVYFAGSCYMFLISSNRFRRETKTRLFFCLRPNQVIPTELPIIRTTTLNKRMKR